jgi:chromosome segregation ATPase
MDTLVQASQTIQNSKAVEQKYYTLPVDYKEIKNCKDQALPLLVKVEEILALLKQQSIDSQQREHELHEKVQSNEEKINSLNEELEKVKQKDVDRERETEEVRRRFQTMAEQAAANEKNTYEEKTKIDDLLKKVTERKKRLRRSKPTNARKNKHP